MSQLRLDAGQHAGQRGANRRSRVPTATRSFGAGRRESHDASAFYARFNGAVLSADDTVHPFFELDVEDAIVCADARDMTLPDGSVALVVTSPPYFSGKEYEQALGQRGVPGSYLDYLRMLKEVFGRCVEVLEPGGRIAVNVANLGRKPYRSLSADVVHILQDELGLLLRGEVIWAKAEGASGSCAWGSFRSAANPVLRDVTERIVIASKGRFDRARPSGQRKAEGLPWLSRVTSDEFMEATLDLWRIPSESASRVGHPAPFPVELPQRLIDLYTYEGDLVLDPFLGCGATAVAAARRRRRYAGYDTDPGYVATARARVLAELERATAGRTDDDGGGTGGDYLSRATLMGKAAHALAVSVLEESGFTVRRRSHRVPGLGVVVDVVAEDARGQPWYFDVTGAFTTTGDGLVRTDTLWKCLGRAAALAGDGRTRPLVLLTTQLPSRRSAGDRAIRAVGPGVVFDALEILSADGAARLRRYARGGHRDRPLAGFWAAGDPDR